MKKLFMLLFTVLYFSLSFAQAPNLIQLMNEISLDSLKLYVRQLSGDTSCIIGGSTYTIVSRHKNQPGNDKAAQFIYEKFQSLGLIAQYETFSTTGKNVIGTKLGAQYPNQYYIICAHFDDMPTGTTAPGADDNASGTAAVMELARVFSKYNFKYTVKFIGWDEEEQGLIGSNYYATQARNRNDSILGVINLDMIAYDNNNDGKCDVHSKAVANTQQIANDFMTNITTFSIPLVPRNVASQPYSDHDSFLKKNYGAILVIEDDNEFNPRYHTVNDKFQYLNMPYAHRITQATGVTIAKYAVMITPNYVTMNTFDGWNLLSVPVEPADNRKTSLFSTAISFAYGYNGNYTVEDTMVLGRGYWLKFGGAQSHAIQGEVRNTVSIPVKSGWNLIGSLNSDISVSNITTNPPGIVSSSFFDYNGGYNPASSIQRAKGYWVKVNQDGLVNLSTTAQRTISFVNTSFSFDAKIVITDNENRQVNLYLSKSSQDGLYELPPIPPLGVFDARFSDNKFIANASEISTILFNSAKFPIKIELQSENSNSSPIILYDDLTRTEYRLSQNKPVLINTPISQIQIVPQVVPYEFTLDQNYPNPFNSQTVINYSLPTSGEVNLTLFNTLGEKVIELVNETKSEGLHQTILNSKNLVSGIYLIQLKFNNKLQVKKCVLLK